MDEEETQEPTGALVVDDDQDEQMEEISLDERKERLKRTRWNVFLYLGVAAIMFGFALFPMPFSADYDDFTDSAEKDIGLVWGLPLNGEGLFDVPMNVEVTATNPPAQNNIDIGVYVLNEDDCASNLGAATELAREGGSHAYQFQTSGEEVLADGTYEFNFDIDPGQYCLIVEYFNETGVKITRSGADMAVDGQLYPNQFFGGVLGLLCLGLSTFAFLGAQKHGAALRSILEGDNESVESKVLADANRALLSAGPSGPPSPGPAGPPGSESTESETPAQSSADAVDVYEPAENGYFFRKLPDGTYDQTVYVQADDGTYQPYQAPQ